MINKKIITLAAAVFVGCDAGPPEGTYPLTEEQRAQVDQNSQNRDTYIAPMVEQLLVVADPLPDASGEVTGENNANLLADLQEGYRLIDEYNADERIVGFDNESIIKTEYHEQASKAAGFIDPNNANYMALNTNGYPWDIGLTEHEIFHVLSGEGHPDKVVEIIKEKNGPPDGENPEFVDAVSSEGDPSSLVDVLLYLPTEMYKIINFIPGQAEWSYDGWELSGWSDSVLENLTGNFQRQLEKSPTEWVSSFLVDEFNENDGGVYTLDKLGISESDFIKIAANSKLTELRQEMLEKEYKEFSRMVVEKKRELEEAKEREAEMKLPSEATPWGKLR